MSRDHTLEQVAEMARQAETVLLMWNRIDSPLCDSETEVMLNLLRRLTGNVAAWLGQEAYDVAEREQTQ